MIQPGVVSAISLEAYSGRCYPQIGFILVWAEKETHGIKMDLSAVFCQDDTKEVGLAGSLALGFKQRPVSCSLNSRASNRSFANAGLFSYFAILGNSRFAFLVRQPDFKQGLELSDCSFRSCRHRASSIMLNLGCGWLSVLYAYWIIWANHLPPSS